MDALQEVELAAEAGAADAGNAPGAANGEPKCWKGVVDDERYRTYMERRAAMMQEWEEGLSQELEGIMEEAMAAEKARRERAAADAAAAATIRSYCARASARGVLPVLLHAHTHTPSIELGVHFMQY